MGIANSLTQPRATGYEESQWGQVLEPKEDPMRKLIMLCAAATMAMSLPVPAQAEAPGGEPAQQALPFCQAQVAADPTLKLGVCMSYFVTSDTGYLTQYCHYLDDTGELDQLGITFSNCILYFRHGG
jgi:hypothetical protein